jgi:hypothetical protein
MRQREVALQRAAAQRVVQRRHDHRLVEHQVTVPDRPGDRIDRVEEPVRAVHTRKMRPQRGDVGEGLLRGHVEGEEGRVRCDHGLAGAAVVLRQSLVRVARVRAHPVVRERQALDAVTGVIAGVVRRARRGHAQTG